MQKLKQYLIYVLVSLLTFTSLLAVLSSSANAASLQGTYVRLNRLKGSTATNFRVAFTVPSGNSGVEAKLKVSFPDSFTVATSGLTATGASGCDVSASALPGTLTVVGSNTPGSKSVIVSGVTNLSASTTYCVDVDKTSTNDPITNPGAGQYSLTVETEDSGSATIDSASVGVTTIGDDQVIVSANVPPAFTFALDANSTSFTSNLDSSNVRQTTGRTVTVTTNASNGWIAWAKDLNTGLSSTSAGHTIASTTPGTAATLSAGAEGYVISAEVTTNAAGGGNPTIPTAYQGTSGDNAGSGLDSTFRQIASSGGTAGGSGDVITIRGKAAVNAATQAGADYGDTWTIIGAGTF